MYKILYVKELMKLILGKNAVKSRRCGIMGFYRGFDDFYMIKIFYIIAGALRGTYLMLLIYKKLSVLILSIPMIC